MSYVFLSPLELARPYPPPRQLTHENMLPFPLSLSLFSLCVAGIGMQFVYINYKWEGGIGANSNGLLFSTSQHRCNAYSMFTCICVEGKGSPRRTYTSAVY
jgi:hypothetical protein